MADRTIVITGANAGLGLGCARHIARHEPGWHVVIACRDTAKGEQAAAKLRALRKRDDIDVVALDLASLDSVRAFPEALAALGAPPIRALVCNAGVQFWTQRCETKEGFEATFGVNHLGHCLLCILVLPLLADSARIVVVASGTHNPEIKTGMPHPTYAPPEQLARLQPAAGEGLGSFGRRAYTTSKLCNVLFTYALDHRLAEFDRADITVNAFDPGAMPTGLARNWPLPARLVLYAAAPLLFLLPQTSTPARSGAMLARLAVDAKYDGTSGSYFSMGKEQPSSKESYDETKQAELWEGSAELVGLDAARAAAMRAT
jgi:NAD(P)-dependent dehydrogenase (short-subunit alcohol dehydrogenase family)